MIKSIQSIYGREIKVGDNFKDYFHGDYTNEKIVTKIVEFIEEKNNGLVYQIIFRDGTDITTSYRNLSRIDE